MASSTYNSQLLALQAAGSINGDGSTPITYGCSMTRATTGVYKLILPTGEGLIEAQSFTTVTAKAGGGGLGTAPSAIPVVSDESNFIKTITMFNGTSGTAPEDCSIEVILNRSTINPF